MGRISTWSGKWGNLLEDQGNVKKKILFIQILNFNKKNHMHTEMYVVELYMTISCIYDAIILI